MLHKLFIPIFRYNNKRVAILGNIRRKIKKQYHFMQESTDKFWTVSHGYVSQPELSCSFWASSVIFKWVNN